MPKKLSMEEQFSRVLEDEALSNDEKLLAIAKIILNHRPKKIRGWASLLRHIADYIDTLPEPVELSAKAIAGLIELDLATREARSR